MNQRKKLKEYSPKGLRIIRRLLDFRQGLEVNGVEFAHQRVFLLLGSARCTAMRFY